MLYSLCSDTGSQKKIIVYTPNQYEFVLCLIVKQKNLGGHDLHVCQISDIFKMADFHNGSQNKKIFSKYAHIVYH